MHFELIFQLVLTVDADATAKDSLLVVEAVIVPNSPLWAPTRSQEMAFAAQASSI